MQTILFLTFGSWLVLSLATRAAGGDVLPNASFEARRDGWSLHVCGARLAAGSRPRYRPIPDSTRRIGSWLTGIAPR